MQPDQLRAAMEASALEALDAAAAIGRRVGRSVTELVAEGRADQGRAAALLEPWVLVDRLGIPREHLPGDSEADFRRLFEHAIRDDSSPACTLCVMVVVAATLALVVAAFIITSFFAPQIAASIVSALLEAGFAVDVAVGVISGVIIGLIAAYVGNPVCSTVGPCS